MIGRVCLGLGIIGFATAMTVACSSDIVDTPTVPSVPGSSTSSGGSSSSGSTNKASCLHKDKDKGFNFDCQTCKTCKDGTSCADGTPVDTCPADPQNGTCKDANPAGQGSIFDVVYYKVPDGEYGGGKSQCDILKGTYEEPK